MRKLYALAAVAMFALTLSLGAVGCAPKSEDHSTTEAPAVEETPAMPDTGMGAADTTSHM